MGVKHEQEGLGVHMLASEVPHSTRQNEGWSEKGTSSRTRPDLLAFLYSVLRQNFKEFVNSKVTPSLPGFVFVKGGR